MKEQIEELRHQVETATGTATLRALVETCRDAERKAWNVVGAKLALGRYATPEQKKEALANVVALGVLATKALGKMYM